MLLKVLIGFLLYLAKAKLALSTQKLSSAIAALDAGRFCHQVA